MRNYFNYFTEIEERFQKRRGSLLMLSTLDWALIETWREAGVPLEIVLRGINDAFDKHDARAAKSARVKKVNGLAWCAQAVMQAAEAMSDAATGMRRDDAAETSESGFEQERIAAYLEENAGELERASLPAAAAEVLTNTAVRLRSIALAVRAEAIKTEDLERMLTVLEEKIYAALTLAADEEEMVRLREEAARELAPYRGKLQAAQLKQVQQQFLQKRLLEARGVPRLSLFYMRQM